MKLVGVRVLTSDTGASYIDVNITDNVKDVQKRLSKALGVEVQATEYYGDTDVVPAYVPLKIDVRSGSARVELIFGRDGEFIGVDGTCGEDMDYAAMLLIQDYEGNIRELDFTPIALMDTAEEVFSVNEDWTLESNLVDCEVSSVGTVHRREYTSDTGKFIHVYPEKCEARTYMSLIKDSESYAVPYNWGEIDILHADANADNTYVAHLNTKVVER